MIKNKFTKNTQTPKPTFTKDATSFCFQEPFASFRNGDFSGASRTKTVNFARSKVCFSISFNTYLIFVFIYITNLFTYFILQSMRTDFASQR